MVSGWSSKSRSCEPGGAFRRGIRVLRTIAGHAGVATHVAVAEEPTSQGGGEFPLVDRLLGRHRIDDLGEPGGLGALGPIQSPGGVHGLLDQEQLDLVLGLKVVDPGFDPELKDVGILVGEDDRLGGHAVLDGVELGAVLAFGRAGTGALLRVPAVDFGPIDGRGCRGHGGLPREWMRRKSLSSRYASYNPSEPVPSCIRIATYYGFPAAECRERVYNRLLRQWLRRRIEGGKTGTGEKRGRRGKNGDVCITLPSHRAMCPNRQSVSDQANRCQTGFLV